MEQIQEVIINGAISILVILLSILFGYLRTVLVAKAKEIRSRQTAEEWQTLQSIAGTVVSAVEQIYSDLKGNEKLMSAIRMMHHELNLRGIKVTESQMKTLIEGAVNELNLTQDSVYDIVSTPIEK